MATGGTPPSPGGASPPPDRAWAGIMAAAKHSLDEDGVTVIPGILTPEECDDHVTQVRKWAAKFGLKGIPDNLNSIVQKYHIAHHPVSWATRLKAAPVFASLWGTEKLTTSFDGMAVGHPQLSFDDGKPLGLHLDQGGSKVGLHSYQAAVYLETADREDWCFAVLNGSHKFHAKFFAKTNKKPWRSEFLKLTQKEVRWYAEQGCELRRVAVPKGGIVVWDSRTVHAGAPPLRKRQHPDRWRHVVFVCMVPAIWASDKDLAKKRTAYHKLYCTHHWPAQGFMKFRQHLMPPELNAVNALPDIAKTEKARLLAGDLGYDFSDGEPNGPVGKIHPDADDTWTIQTDATGKPLPTSAPALVTPTQKDIKQAENGKKRKGSGAGGNSSKRHKVNPTKKSTVVSKKATGKKKAMQPAKGSKTKQQRKKKGSI